MHKDSNKGCKCKECIDTTDSNVYYHRGNYSKEEPFNNKKTPVIMDFKGINLHMIIKQCESSIDKITPEYIFDYIPDEHWRMVEEYSLRCEKTEDGYVINLHHVKDKVIE